MRGCLTHRPIRLCPASSGKLIVCLGEGCCNPEDHTVRLVIDLRSPPDLAGEDALNQLRAETGTRRGGYRWAAHFRPGEMQTMWTRAIDDLPLQANTAAVSREGSIFGCVRRHFVKPKSKGDSHTWRQLEIRAIEFEMCSVIDSEWRERSLEQRAH